MHSCELKGGRERGGERERGERERGRERERERGRERRGREGTTHSPSLLQTSWSSFVVHLETNLEQ